MQRDLKNMQRPEKHTFFYSKTCARSRDVATLISQRGVRDRFIFISVEQYQNSLPPFVKTVPLIYTSNSEVLTDDDLVLFVRHIQPQQGSQGIPHQEPQGPLELASGGSGLSDTFSFISGSGDQSDQMSSRSYDFIESPQQQQQQQRQPQQHIAARACQDEEKQRRLFHRTRSHEGDA